MRSLIVASFLAAALCPSLARAMPSPRAAGADLVPALSIDLDLSAPAASLPALAGLRLRDPGSGQGEEPTPKETDIILGMTFGLSFGIPGLIFVLVADPDRSSGRTLGTMGGIFLTVGAIGLGYALIAAML